jgi:hypothetical protein
VVPEEVIELNTYDIKLSPLVLKFMGFFFFCPFNKELPVLEAC